MEVKQIIVVFNKPDIYGMLSHWYDSYSVDGETFTLTWRGIETKVDKVGINCIYTLTTTQRGEWYPNDKIITCP